MRSTESRENSTMRVFWRFLGCYCRFNGYYRVRFWAEFVRDGLMMYSYYALWSVMYDYGMGYAGATRIQLLTYGVVGGLVTTFITRDGCQRYIRERIMNGTMDADLVKPVGLQRHMLVRDLAQKLSKLIQFTIPTLIVFIVLAGMYYLPSVEKLLLFAVSLFLAYLVLFSINYLFGLLCFITLSVENIYFCYTAVVCFLSGQFVPLWMFPQWAQKIITVLPFRCIYDIPMSIYIGRTELPGAMRDLLLQMIWAFVLWVTGAVLWKTVKKRILSQGG